MSFEPPSPHRNALFLMLGYYCDITAIALPYKQEVNVLVLFSP